MKQQLAHSRPGSRFRESAIILGNADVARLRAVVERHLGGRDRAAAEQLEAELDRAIVVPQAKVPPEIVTMCSRIVFRDVGTGRSRVITLCHPAEADPAQGWISILAPVATALLGLGVGDTIDWPMPDGKTARLQITSVLYRPEARRFPTLKRVGGWRVRGPAAPPLSRPISRQRPIDLHRKNAMVITKKDMELLRTLVEIHSFGGDSEAGARLGAELARASVVPSEQVPVDVVTMNSRVVFEDEAATRREALLVYPPAADGSRDRVSVPAVGAIHRRGAPARR